MSEPSPERRAVPLAVFRQTLFESHVQSALLGQAFGLLAKSFRCWQQQQQQSFSTSRGTSSSRQRALPSPRGVNLGSPPVSNGKIDPFDDDREQQARAPVQSMLSEDNVGDTLARAMLLSLSVRLAGVERRAEAEGEGRKAAEVALDELKRQHEGHRASLAEGSVVGAPSPSTPPWLTAAAGAVTVTTEDEVMAITTTAHRLEEELMEWEKTLELREASVAAREASTAAREAAVGVRETQVEARHDLLATRDEDAKAREAGADRRSSTVEMREAAAEALNAAAEAGHGVIAERDLTSRAREAELERREAAMQAREASAAARELASDAAASAAAAKLANASTKIAAANAEAASLGPSGEAARATGRVMEALTAITDVAEAVLTARPLPQPVAHGLVGALGAMRVAVRAHLDAAAEEGRRLVGQSIARAQLLAEREAEAARREDEARRETKRRVAAAQALVVRRAVSASRMQGEQRAWRALTAHAAASQEASRRARLRHLLREHLRTMCEIAAGPAPKGSHRGGEAAESYRSPPPTATRPAQERGAATA